MLGGVACNCCVRLRTINVGAFFVTTNALAELLNKVPIINVVNKNVLRMLLFMTVGGGVSGGGGEQHNSSRYGRRRMLSSVKSTIGLASALGARAFGKPDQGQ